jgi:hypothetical protein
MKCLPTSASAGSLEGSWDVGYLIRDNPEPAKLAARGFNVPAICRWLRTLHEDLWNALSDPIRSVRTGSLQRVEFLGVLAYVIDESAHDIWFEITNRKASGELKLTPFGTSSGS